MRAKKLKVGHKKTHAKTHRAKTQTPAQIAKGKWRLAVQRCKEINTIWQKKLAEKTAEFKQKLDEVASTAYHKAVETLSTENRRRIEAKAKALAAAEAKFEKKFAKTFAKKVKRHGKAKKHTSTVHAHTLTTHATTTAKHVGKKRGKKSGKKTALHVTSHRMTTTHTKRRGRPAKHRGHEVVRTAGRRTAK